MQYISTQDEHYAVTLSHAILYGAPVDGGLFVPNYWPAIPWEAWPDNLSYVDFSIRVLEPFFFGDELCHSLSDICHEAFTFPIPLQRLNQNTFLMELFHGPTLSFKDVGARFLSACVSHAHQQKIMTIFVATSGDTGSAVAAAFNKKKNVRVVVLFPKGGVTARQKQGLVCWGDNVLSVEVDGSFDDCQAMLKRALANPWWQQKTIINTANSINIARLLPQLTYYAYHAWRFYRNYKEKPGIIIPSGNLGNAFAACMAQRIGFPIRAIAMSVNANRPVIDYWQSGVYQSKPTIKTLANAMDVGNPSNLNRLHYLYGDIATIKKFITVEQVLDEAIKATIKEVHTAEESIVCPHTATALSMRKQLDSTPWLVAATAHPCKFEQVIEPLINKDVAVPERFKVLLDHQPDYIELDPDDAKLREAYCSYFNV